MKHSLLSILLLLIVGTANIFADDFEVMRRNLREHITLGQTDYDPSNTQIRSYLNSVNKSAAGFQQTMRHDTTILWNDLNKLHNVPSFTPVHINSSYNRLLVMARAWAYPGGELYHNQQLLQDIKYGLSLLYKEAYNTKTKRIGSWWEWIIGIPWNYANIVSILYEELDANELNQYEESVAKWVRANAKKEYLTYANQASICRNLLALGILTNNKSDVEAALNSAIPAFCDDARASQRMSSIHRQNRFMRNKWSLRNVKLIENKEGLYEDGTFIQHSAVPYIGTYGQEIIQMAGYMAWLIPNTSFSVPQKIIDVLPIWVNKSYIPAMYRGEMMLMLMGRANTDDPYIKAKNTAVAILAAAPLIADPEKREEAVKYASNMIAKDVHYSTPYVGLTPLPVYKPIVDYAITMASTDEKDMPFSIVWAAGDRVIHQTENWRACVSMSSNRIAKYECYMRPSSNQNTKGWYTGDGMTYLYLPSDPKQYYQYMLNVNPYRLPGTTVDVVERQEVISMEPSFGHSPKAPSVARAGGVALGKYRSSAMMQLLGAVSDLTAKKSWFMLGNEVVCLGADINLSDKREAITIVENRRYKHPLYVKSANANDAVAVSNAVDKSIDNVSWAYLETIGGYVFLEAPNLYVNQTDKDNTELWLSHGISPNGAAYQYILLPGMNKNEVADYAEKPAVNVLSNNNLIQAIYVPSEQLTAINFWKSARIDVPQVGKVSCNKMAAVMMQTEENKLVISISDPSWETRTQVLTIEGLYNLQNAEPQDNVTAKTSNGQTRLTINQHHRLGMTQTITLIKQ